MISLNYKFNKKSKVIFFFASLLFIFQISLGQEVVVKLEKQTGHGFRNTIHGFHKLDSTFLKTIEFTPTDSKEFSLYYINLLSNDAHSSYLRDSVLLILYIDDNGARNVIIDEDYDMNFNNNVIYKFSPETTKYPIVSLRKRRIVDQDTIIQYFPFELRAFDNRSFVRGRVQELTLTEQWYKKGKVNLKNRDYFVWLKESELQSNNKSIIHVDYTNDAKGAKPGYLLEEIVPMDTWSLKMELIEDDRLKITVINSVDYGEMPGFVKEDIITGESIELQDFKGQYVLLDFWGSWCVPCIEGIPNLKNTVEKFKNKLKVISIAYDKSEDLPKLKKLITDNQMNWSHLVDLRDLKNENSLIKSLNIVAYPTFIVLDKNQKIVLKKSGNNSLKEINEFLEGVLD